MDTQPNRQSARLANAGLILGILSFGFFLFACLILVWVKLSPSDVGLAILFLSFAIFSILGSLMVGIPGLIIGFIALKRISNQGGDHKIMRTTIISLVLNGFGIVVLLIYLGYTIAFNPPTPPPVEITPLTPGG